MLIFKFTAGTGFNMERLFYLSNEWLLCLGCSRKCISWLYLSASRRVLWKDPIMAEEQFDFFWLIFTECHIFVKSSFCIGNWPKMSSDFVFPRTQVKIKPFYYTLFTSLSSFFHSWLFSVLLVLLLYVFLIGIPTIKQFRGVFVDGAGLN